MGERDTLMKNTDALEVYTVSLLKHKDQYLLLQRSQNKLFAPGRWTGLGGHVEANEFHQLRAAALREVQEEAGIIPQDIFEFVLRRTLLVSRPNQPIRVVLYFSGLINQFVSPDCPEGTLSWKQETEFENIDIIETTRPVLYLLVKDIAADPEGLERPKIGMAVFDSSGIFQNLVWAG